MKVWNYDSKPVDHRWQNKKNDNYPKPRTIAKNTLSFSCSKSMTYLRTPTDTWAQLSREFPFTIDVCASHDNHLLPRYYTIEDNGLKQDWTGEVVYCHPLFDSKIGRWVKKAHESKCLTVLLLPAATHTKYFHEHIYHNPRAEVRFLRKPKRGFRFLKDDGSPDDLTRIGYIKPLMVVIFRNECPALHSVQDDWGCGGAGAYRMDRSAWPLRKAIGTDGSAQDHAT